MMTLFPHWTVCLYLSWCLSALLCFFVVVTCKANLVVSIFCFSYIIQTHFKKCKMVFTFVSRQLPPGQFPLGHKIALQATISWQFPPQQFPTRRIPLCQLPSDIPSGKGLRMRKGFVKLSVGNCYGTTQYQSWSGIGWLGWLYVVYNPTEL